MPGCVYLWTGLWSCYKAHRPQLVYQSTTSLGLGQVQMPRPGEDLATGAAARGSKTWYNLFYRITVFVACQVRAYPSSLELPPYSVTQIWY